MEQDFRKQAIARYLKGESPKSIYSDLDRSKNWFFKWLKRYQSGEPNWYGDQVSGGRSMDLHDENIVRIDVKRLTCDALYP